MVLAPEVVGCEVNGMVVLEASDFVLPQELGQLAELLACLACLLYSLLLFAVGFVSILVLLKGVHALLSTNDTLMLNGSLFDFAACHLRSAALSSPLAGGSFAVRGLSCPNLAHRPSFVSNL